MDELGEVERCLGVRLSVPVEVPEPVRDGDKVELLVLECLEQSKDFLWQCAGQE